MKVMLGIISYLPDDPELRVNRLNRLNTLLQTSQEIFGVPIVIIAQNWKGLSLRKDAFKVPLTIYTYNQRLGINGARRELRKKFLESDYDYIIHLDDDCVLTGTKKGGQLYLYQLLQNPDKYAFYKPHLLKLAAISKAVYKLIDIPDGGADDNDQWMRMFEDMWVTEMLLKWYPEKAFKFIHHELNEVSNSAYDNANSGWHEVYDDSENQWTRRFTGNNTRYAMYYSPIEALLDSTQIARRDHLDYREKKKPNTMLWTNYKEKKHGRH